MKARTHTVQGNAGEVEGFRDLIFPEVLMFCAWGIAPSAVKYHLIDERVRGGGDQQIGPPILGAILMAGGDRGADRRPG